MHNRNNCASHSNNRYIRKHLSSTTDEKQCILEKYLRYQYLRQPWFAKIYEISLSVNCKDGKD